MKKPRILIFSLAYYPFIGGAEIAVQEITKRLGDDFEFDLICARMNKKLAKKEKIGNINIYRIGFGFKNLDKYIFTFFGFFKAFKLYRKNRYKIIWPIMAAYSSFAVLFKIFTKAKVILTLQEGDPLNYIMNLKRFRFFKSIYRLYFKKVDRVQVISNYLKDWAINLGIKKEKIVVVPNGVDIEKFSNLKKTKNKEEKIILTDSRLVGKNGVEHLVKAINLIKNIKLIIIGDGTEKGRIVSLVNQFDLNDRCQILEKISYDKIQNYYTQADVFCRPSLSEGFGNVFVQAMAAEIPVVATPVGGIPDFLEDGETGWFCEPKNPQSIAEKIKYILDEKNKAEVEQVVANAKKMVEEKYTWDKIAQQMKEIFDKLISEGK